MRSILKKLLSPFLQKAGALYVSKPRKYTYKNLSVVVQPGVFPPFLTISTKLLLDFVDNLDLEGKTFLELGCGCGIISILAAKKGALVTASDISTIALEALRTNSEANQTSIDVIHSDLFDSLGNKAFDFIVINPPYYPKNPTNIAESAWFCGENFEYFQKLFKQLPQNSATVFMILSEDCEIETIKSLGQIQGFTLELISSKKVVAEENFIFSIVPSSR
ncbi:MAG TPA: methyltransferase [Flavobacterium sp.]|jgi:release factor glutamine methyltransferase